MNKCFFLRIGSNAEKKYIEKTATLFSGLFCRANLFESSPGLISSICLRLHSLRPSKGYAIDPVTYVFGLDPKEAKILSWQIAKKSEAQKRLRKDLMLSKNEGIPSELIEQIKDTANREEKVSIFTVKRSYKELRNQIFNKKTIRSICRRAIQPSDFNNNQIEELVQSTIRYQKTAISSYYDASKYEDFKEGIPTPMYIFSPYFIVNSKNWLNVMTKIWSAFENQEKLSNAATMVLCTIEYLKSNHDSFINAISKTKIGNIFIWIDDFNEATETEENLLAFSNFVIEISSMGKNIFNMRGGGLSMFLLPFGLSGLISNPGYGMDRKFIPAVGGPPEAWFYIPSNHRREPVGKAHDLIVRSNLGKDRDNFIKQICSCPICQYIIRNGREDLPLYFGRRGEEIEFRDGRPPRSFPTSEALELCKLHFIFSRLIEYRWALSASKKDAINVLASEIKKWKKGNEHLKVWKSVLKNIK